MNLTETQKRVLRWLVEEERAGNLEKEGIWFTPIFPNSMSLITTYRGKLSNIPQIERTTFDALRSSGCLKCDWTGKCALTDEAYDAVDSNFSVTTQNIGNNPSQLAKKIGIVAQPRSTVNIGTLNITGTENTQNIQKQITVNQSGSHNTQNNTFNL